MDQLNLGLLMLRLCLGLFLAYHGYNKFFGGGRIPGTARWFASMGMKWPKAQALLAVCTEVGAGVMFAIGLFTPLAAAGIIGVMLVAIYTEHWKVGFFIFKPNQGWEYCATIAIGALAVATMGAGEWAVDHALNLDVEGWWGLGIAGIVGVGGAALQLATSYRPPKQAAVNAPTIDRPAYGDAPEPERPPRKWVRWLIVVACLPILAMWVYAFGFASKEPAVHIDDTAWTQRAQGICASANAERDALFDPRKISDSGPDALSQRADIVDQATVILQRMIDEIVAVRPTGAQDQQLVAQWEGYYRTLIQDRHDYTARLRAGGPNRFDETVVEDEPLSGFLDDFALPNHMPDCVSPNDLS